MTSSPYARGIAVAVLMLACVPPAIGQEGLAPTREPDARRPAATSIEVREPSDTEVLSLERGSTISQPPVASVPLEHPVDPNVYVCGRGDQFELNFWGQQNFRHRVTVDTEGRLFIPKIGYANVAGKTLAQARTMITQSVHRYYPGLNFDMSLSVPRTFLVHIVGFVARPGIYRATALERLTTVLASAGEITGSRRRIDVKHRDGSHAMADLVMYDHTGDTQLNPFVMDGDVITVPFADLAVTVGGAVRRPGRYELIRTKDLAEALEIAGGTTPLLTRALPIRVTHRNAQQRSAITELTFPADPNRIPNTPLQDHDDVAVPSVAELQRSVLVVGPVAGATAADEVTTTRRFPFSEGLTVHTLVESAGPIGASADLEGAFIRRGMQTVHVDLDALLVRRDFSHDVPIEMGDVLVIPQKRRGVAVEGAVLRPAIYPFNPDFKASQYIDIAGGPKSNARTTSSYRLIGSNGHVKRLTSATLIDPGDTILVPERTFTRSEVVQLVMGGVGLALSTFTLVYLVVVK